MKLSEQEKDKIIDAAIDAQLAGDIETARTLFRKIPVDAQFAWGIKDAGGPEVLQSMIADGYDMSEVESTYGPDWLKA